MNYLKSISLLFFFFVFLQYFVHSAIPEDEITSIPGYPGRLPSRMYSGYISVGNGARHLHYWFIESEGNPRDDPVLLWLQGGPGSSAMLGLLTENGPFFLDDFSFQVSPGESLRVFRNHFSWTKLGNVLYVEAPAGVGFSYCDGGCFQFNDDLAALDNYEFISKFFSYFSEFKNNPFYITGESYAGIYVPMLANIVMEDSTINFQGVAVGNGCVGMLAEGGCSPDSLYWLVDIIHGLGQVSTNTYHELMNKCKSVLLDSISQPFSEECANLLKQFQNEVGFYNPYNIFDECAGRNDVIVEEYYKRENKQSKYNMSPLFLSIADAPFYFQNGLNGYPCGIERGMNEWLEDARVQEALHVSKFENRFSYLWTMQDVRPIYKRLIENGYRVLIFYGDTDTVVPVNGGEHWTSNLGLEVEEPYRAWTLNGGQETAGHVVRYKDNFTFLTIRGAGHMVPTYQPAAALSMMYYFLNDIKFPRSGDIARSPPLKLEQILSEAPKLTKRSKVGRNFHVAKMQMEEENKKLKQKIDELSSQLKIQEKNRLIFADF